MVGGDRHLPGGVGRRGVAVGSALAEEVLGAVRGGDSPVLVVGDDRAELGDARAVVLLQPPVGSAGLAHELPGVAVHGQEGVVPLLVVGLLLVGVPAQIQRVRGGVVAAGAVVVAGLVLALDERCAEFEPFAHPGCLVVRVGHTAVGASGGVGQLQAGHHPALGGWDPQWVRPGELSAGAPGCPTGGRLQ